MVTSCVPACGSNLPYTEFVGDLGKSASDTREYRLIRLPNGLTAMCVHDPTESKSCAALDVNVGSLADPPEFQGLAHFCEHLLFMGTERYPKENEYNAYLSAHGGYSNAYTDLEDTCYYFEVTYDALEGALDRFSQFFINPLFTADCTDREVRAVDSEHKKNIQNDMWRQYQIEKELSSPSHPFNLFATGNADTLTGAAKELGVDLREELLKFHAKYYSADIMKLVIVGRDSLDQLAEWAVSKFSEIESKGMTKPLFKGHPLTKKEVGKLIRIKSIREQRTLDLTFPLPDLKPYYLTKPARYLGSLIGHEGKGSVLSYLKRRGWATSIVAGRSPTSADGFDMFKVTVSLTELGMKHYKDVVRAIFAFIQLLLSKEPQKWFQDELQRVSEIEYKFMEKNDAVNLASTLASIMQNRYLPPQNILSNNILLRGFDEELVKRVQSELNPDNFRVLLAAREFDVECERKEKYYGISYRVDPIPEDLMADIHGELLFDELHLPEPNWFIPDNLDVDKPERPAEPAQAPVLLRRTQGAEVWFKRDDRFFLPRGEIRIVVETPRVYESPLNSILSQLFVLILKDSLSEITYDAQVAGLWFDIRDSADGIFLHLDGFNDKLPRLLEILLKALRSHKVDDTRFEVYSREVKKKLDNAKHSEPYNHIQTNVNFLNQAMMWRYSDKLSAFDMVTKEKLQLFIDSLFDLARVQMIVMGNFSEADALATADSIVEVLGFKPLPDYARRVPRALLHNPGTFIHHATMPDEGNLNSGVDQSIYTGSAENYRERALLDLLSLIMQEPFFDQLRTKEQLGYITYSSDRKYNGGPMALRLLVQSESNPAYVSLRIDQFISGFRKRLEEMTQEEFDRYVNSLKVKKEEKLKNLYEETSRFWHHVCSGYYEFDKIDHDISNLLSLTKADILAFWDQYVNPLTAPRYTRLTAAIWSSKIPQPLYEDLAKYPAISIALHGCLHRDGATELSLDDVDRFIGSLSGADSDAAFEGLKALYEEAAAKADKPSADVQRVVSKIAGQSSYVRTALSMAAEGPSAGHSAEAPTANGVNSAKSKSSAVADKGSLENIGAIKTPSGAWVFREASTFKATLRQSGAPIPTRPLEPKYK
ncbi:hypothetical protein GQ54DRAFT_328450 [Martensiomyces pterosporus]|nr:hypothetical protein GQ54DRAFT_328450 [Martensiomyces pterosporus]